MKKLISTGLLLVSLFAVAGCAKTEAGMSIDEVQVCLTPANGVCGLDAVNFPRDAEEIFVSAVLHDAPTNTKVDFNWFYVDGQQDIDTVTLGAEKAGDSSLRSSLPRPTFEGGWPAGKYNVRISVQGHPEIKTIVKDFSIQ